MSHRFTVASVVFVLFQLSVAAGQSSRDDNPKPRQSVQYSPVLPGIAPIASEQSSGRNRSELSALRGVQRVRIRIADEFGERWEVDLSRVKADIQKHMREVGIEVMPDTEASVPSLNVEVIVSKDADKEGDLLVNARLAEGVSADKDAATATPESTWHNDVSVRWNGTLDVPDLIRKGIEMVLDKFIRDYVAANRK